MKNTRVAQLCQLPECEGFFEVSTHRINRVLQFLSGKKASRRTL